VSVDLYDGDRKVATGEVGEWIAVPPCTVTAVRYTDPDGHEHKVDVVPQTYARPGTYSWAHAPRLVPVKARR
jgi:hypothetical protein